MNEDIKKLALEALELQKKVKLDQEKLQNIKEKIIKLSESKNSSYSVNLLAGTVRVTKSKKLISYLLDSKEFDKLDLQEKKKLLQIRINGKKVLKLKFALQPDEYKTLLTQKLVPEELKKLVSERERKPFYVSIILEKKLIKEKITEDEIDQIFNYSKDDEEEIDDDKEEDLYDILSNPSRVFEEINEDDENDN
ncbi:hypothetical protein IDG96_00185 [Pelagibacterales bacterium SAG-MED16]|nr:hypothetical protein [Pelagibacterales bacterium SAG-MED16]